MMKGAEAQKTDPVSRLEAHIWFEDFDEYAAREKELIELLGRIQGDGSVTVFLRATPEYCEIPGASFDYRDTGKVDELVRFCGADNIDFVLRVGRNAERESGLLRWKGSGRGESDGIEADGLAEEADSG